MIYYDEYGNRDNPTTLMLHGAGTLDTFSHQYCFSDQYHFIVPHLPGDGKAADIKRISFYCNRDGLFYIDPVKGIDDKESGYDDVRERRKLERT